ncbi:Nif3-like dinuclear metal center hexameric protein [Larkinella punicea]|uniref:GTP cyclohydrolase 1 type 2 homolog n=1 Tax=Larkinella punicea TaxID=2315727 RepID=A0A368JFS7_9BACT|nr:Nif3-like dinuclear metal center hexameric protein [Larkinella punicea]RCR66518.1 Nif3-like dinuclear metal center hexameric protein [Larkinella punicea]
MTIRDITTCLEAWAPLAYQESYDNAGLIVGDAAAEVTGILVTLDVTEAVVEEAIRKNCNLIVAHHPIVFRGLKKFNGRNYVERVVIKAIKNDVALYAAHTNLDNIAGGVSFRIADQLGLQKVRILAPKSDVLMKLVTFVPNEQEGPAFKEATQTVLNALYEAGVGQIGQYDHCSFRTEGTGTFRGNDTSKPALGKSGEDTRAYENRIEAIFPAYLQPKVLAALRKAHPYEEVAYYLTALTNENQEVGSGAVGELPEPLSEVDFLAHLKTQMNLSVIRHTALRGLPVRRVAVCGGAGGFLLNDALKAGADVFITADYKYHEFFDADSRIIIADIGHYESEVFTKDLIQQYLLKKNDTFAVILSEIDTNPVLYYL